MSIIVQEMGLSSTHYGMESADTIEMDFLTDTAELDSLENDIDTAFNAVAGLESLTQVEGVPGPVLLVAAENMLAHMGYHGDTGIPSMESEADTTYGMEGIGEIIKKIWEAISNAFKKVWGAIKKFFKKLFGVKEKVDVKAEQAKKLAKILEKTELAKEEMKPKPYEVDDVRLFGGKKSGDDIDSKYLINVSNLKMVNGQVWTNLNAVYDFNREDMSYSEFITHVRSSTKGSLGLGPKVHNDLPNGNGIPRTSYRYSEKAELGTGGFYSYWKTDSDDFPMTGFEPYMFGKKIPGTVMVDVFRSSTLRHIFATLDVWVKNSPEREDTDKVLELLNVHMGIVEKHLSDVGDGEGSAKMSKVIKQMGINGKNMMSAFTKYITFAVNRYKVVVDTLAKSMRDPAKVLAEQKASSDKARKVQAELRKALDDPNGTVVI